MKLASASLFAALPLLSFATASAATAVPVKITQCTVAKVSVSVPGVTGINRTNGVTVTFVNTSAKTIKAVTIAGDYNGYKVTDSVTGPFAPGSSTTLSRSYSPTAYTGPTASCHLTRADFTDGTSWTATATTI